MGSRRGGGEGQMGRGRAHLAHASAKRRKGDSLTVMVTVKQPGAATPVISTRSSHAEPHPHGGAQRQPTPRPHHAHTHTRARTHLSPYDLPRVSDSTSRPISPSMYSRACASGATSAGRQLLAARCTLSLGVLSTPSRMSVTAARFGSSGSKCRAMVPSSTTTPARHHTCTHTSSFIIHT